MSERKLAVLRQKPKAMPNCGRSNVVKKVNREAPKTSVESFLMTRFYLNHTHIKVYQ